MDDLGPQREHRRRGRPADTDADTETWRAFLSALPRGPDTTGGGQRPPVPRPVEVPTVFDGPDLEEVAALVGTDVTAVVEQLCDATLEVAFIGFSPGFPYLVGLPEGLAGVPRRPTPRTEVEAGSVALAGGFAGIYPQPTPGGWRLVGWTALRLFDPTSPPFARLRAGQRASSSRRSQRIGPVTGGRPPVSLVS